MAIILWTKLNFTCIANSTITKETAFITSLESNWIRHSMDQEKTLYTRSEITQKLGIQSYILSLWEKEFGLALIISADGQTLYTSDNYQQLKKIKALIYENGHSLEGAKKAINENRTDTPIRAASPLFDGPKQPKAPVIDPKFSENLQNLQKQLIKLKQLL